MPIFWQLANYSNSQNSIIFFGYYVDFEAKIFLILYPRTWNSITGIGIVWSLGFDKWAVAHEMGCQAYVKWVLMHI